MVSLDILGASGGAGVGAAIGLLFSFNSFEIQEEKDIDILKSIGKYCVYVGSIPEGFIHEDDCAIRIAKAICNYAEKS